MGSYNLLPRTDRNWEMTKQVDSAESDTQYGLVPRELAFEKPAIELFDMMLRGEIPQPPISRTLNFKLTDASKGRAVFRGTPLADFYNPMGSVHGGWPATLLDSSLGCAVHTMLPAGIGYSTVEFKIHLVRPMFENTGEVVCEGKIVHFGRTIATSEASIHTAEGKLIAHGTETCAIFPLPKPE